MSGLLVGEPKKKGGVNIEKLIINLSCEFLNSCRAVKNLQLAILYTSELQGL